MIFVLLEPVDPKDNVKALDASHGGPQRTGEGAHGYGEGPVFLLHQ